MPYKKPNSCSLQEQLTQLLYQEMKRQGLSQAALARKAHVSSKHICHMMTGVQAGSIKMWSHLFETLGVKVWPSNRPAPSAGTN